MTNHYPNPVQILTVPDNSPNSYQQTVWSQLSSIQRRQLAQQLAQLIRRLRDQTSQPQERAHD